MKKEIIQVNNKETSVKMQTSEIISLRAKDIDKSAVRVYKDGKVGISGAVGTSSIEDLTAQAIENLSSNIKYPYELEKNRKDHRNYIEKQYSEKELMDLGKTLSDSFKNDFDDFIFNDSIKKIETDFRFTNSEGLDLRYQDSYLDFNFLVKSKDSANLFDTFSRWRGRNFDTTRYLSTTKMQLDAERNIVELPKENKVPVFFVESDIITDFLNSHLSGDNYGNETSLFTKKIGTKIFNDKVSIVQNNNSKYSYSCFFDTEGITNKNDVVTLIENGVFKRVFTDKKIAEKFNIEHTGSASGGYDDVPSLRFTNIEPVVDSSNIKKSLNGKMAILVVVAAGGSFNSDGKFSTPVQTSYLYDGENLIGKLPEFNISNDIYNMLGDDYIGTFKSETLYFSEHGYLLGSYMNIIK
ncbi:hypothetical protein CI105_08350 [Candidatus Izimaplasma bacterium ZiA1]|uniref:metallopeptidase TldD-related protein n=1 Tax=Candidatus Izimoplasma sp. ZiA1 TaxID=2024899 RepID=UPI000BAA93BA|nr:hypothetical protein CI105_08350 [Candidatus Izimaplasma bacterium ZiA1]